MPATILGSDRACNAVCVLLEFDENRCEDLAGIIARWIPSAHELQALERCVRDLTPEYETKWSKDLESYWSYYDRGPISTTIGQPIYTSTWMATGLEATRSLSVRTVVPVVQIAIPHNPRAFWLNHPHRSLHWLCRPVDLVAIHSTIVRYCEFEFTCRNDLLDLFAKVYDEAPTMPINRLRK